MSGPAPPPSPALNHYYSHPSPLQSSAITSVIVEPFDRVAINPSPSPSTTPTPTGISPTPGCTTPTLSHIPPNNMAMEEDSPIKPVISSQNMPIKRKIRLEMKACEVICIFFSHLFDTIIPTGRALGSPAFCSSPTGCRGRKETGWGAWSLIVLVNNSLFCDFQEDEMMDCGGTTPVGTPTPGSPSATPPPICIREQPTSTTNVRTCTCSL